MENKAIIQPAADGHRDAIIGLLQAEKLPVEDLPAALENFFVAVHTGMVVGAAGIEVYGNYGLLRSLVVAQGCRSQSVAAQLVQAVEIRAAALQLESLYLLTETAQGYFSKKGYFVITRGEVPEAVKESSEFSHVCPVSAVVMLKQIT